MDMVYRAMRFQKTAARSQWLLSVATTVAALFESHVHTLCPEGSLPLKKKRKHSTVGQLVDQAEALDETGNPKELVVKKRLWHLRRNASELLLMRLFLVCHRLFW